jgi:hypothetical protein
VTHQENRRTTIVFTVFSQHDAGLCPVDVSSGDRKIFWLSLRGKPVALHTVMPTAEPFRMDWPPGALAYRRALEPRRSQR